MFSSSSQRRHWMFEGPEDLEKLRHSANKSICKSMLKAGKVSSPENLLSAKDELQLLRSYLVNLREFCRKFTPPMRKSVIATAFIYMKRFYLHESCMQYHPRNIGITCAYLACKVDEFNVSIDQFIKNVKGDCRKAQKTVLSNELMLMKKLKFHLTVHLPYRAVEGFLIDLRARYPAARDTEVLVPEIEDYLEKCMFTDACLLFSPSQIALAAVWHSAQKANVNLEPYLAEMLFAEQPDAYGYFRELADQLARLIELDQQSGHSAGKEAIKKIEKKLAELM